MLQNATPLRKSAPWPPNISDEHIFCTAPATRNASLQILFKCPTPAIVFGNATKPSRFAHFWEGAQPLAPATRKHIWTSKSAPYPFVFLHFWLQNVLRATMACAFSTSQLLKVVRRWCVLYILTSKCASRHNGVQFFISHLARWLRTRRFSEPTFRPSRATNHWKNTVFRDFPTFSRICVFFLLTLSLLWSSLFYSSLLSDSSHLCFSSVHIVGSLTSKLPSVNIIICTVYICRCFAYHQWFFLPCLTSRSLYHLGLCPGEIRQALRLKVLQGMTTDHGYNWYPLVIPIFSYNHDD